MHGYFLFDPVDDPAAFGLRGEVVPTSLGDLHVLRPAGGRLPKACACTASVSGGRESRPRPRCRPAVVSRGPEWLRPLGDLRGPVTLDEIVTALVDVLDRVEVPSLDVVGHSMGGFTALHLTATHPDRVRSVGSVSGSYVSVLDVINALVRSLARVPRTWLVGHGALGVPERARPVVPGEGPQQRLRGLRLTYRSLAVVAGGGRAIHTLVRAAASTGLLRLGLGGFGLGYDWPRQWGDIGCHALGVSGSEDRLVPPRDAAALGAARPGVQTQVLSDAANLAPLEQPVALMSLLHGWWEQDNTPPAE